MCPADLSAGLLVWEQCAYDSTVLAFWKMTFISFAHKKANILGGTMASCVSRNKQTLMLTHKTILVSLKRHQSTVERRKQVNHATIYCISIQMH